jgi:hypothetical protein
MTPPKIIITVTPGKGVEIEAVNFQGAECLKETQALRDMGESETELKSEFYDAPVEVTTSSQIEMNL